MSDGLVVLGGAGGTRARLDDLALACDALRRVVTCLDDARRRVGIARWAIESSTGRDEAAHARAVALDRLWWVNQGRGGLGGTAAEVEGVARDLREMVGLMEAAEAHSGSIMKGLGRTWDKAFALGSAAVWLPLKATGVVVSTGAQAAQVLSPDILHMDWALGGVENIGNAINPDWSPHLTPLLYGDDVQDLMKWANTLWSGATFANRMVQRALGCDGPDSLVTFVASNIALVTMALDSILGDPYGLSVVPVRSRVVTPPDGIEDLMLRTDRLSPTGPDGPSRIAIERVDHDDGTTAWVVELPGTQDWVPDGDTNLLNVTADAQLMAGGTSALTDAVEEAMRQAGIPPGDPVMLVGHSLGGIAAMSLVSRPAFTSRYNVRAVVTAGSPVAGFKPPASTTVLSLEHPSDTVPSLDGADNPDRPNWITVRRELADSSDPADRLADNDVLERHHLPAYARTGAAVDASGDPSLRAWRADTEMFFSTTEGTSTRTVFEVTQGSRQILLPGQPGFEQVDGRLW